MGIIEKWNLARNRPVLLTLSDEQILDWLDEMNPEIKWQKGDSHTLSGVYLTIPETGPTFAQTIREAVCRADVKWKEINS